VSGPDATVEVSAWEGETLTEFTVRSKRWDRVEIEVDGKWYEVVARDLVKAVEAAVAVKL